MIQGLLAEVERLRAERDALMDDVQSTGKLWHEAEASLEQARVDRDEAIAQCVSIGRESKKLEAEIERLRGQVAEMLKAASLLDQAATDYRKERDALRVVRHPRRWFPRP